MNGNQIEQLALGSQPSIQPQMDINMDALISEWETSEAWVRQYTSDFPQLDDLVDAIPLDSDPDVPFVGDTTISGLVRSIPRDSLEQLPTFSAIVNGSKKTIPALLCSFFLKKYIFNEDTFGKGLLSTLQIGAEQALTHGFAPFMVSTGSMFNDFGTTMRLLHYNDTAPEPGVTDANESGYHFVVANLVPSRVRKILKKARNNPNTHWNPDALEELLKQDPQPKNYSIFDSRARRNQSAEALSKNYQFITRYETGSDATVITFCPSLRETALRVFDSNSRWGYPRVQYLVIDPAALTPFGTSRVRLASPNQNLMNIYYGNIAAMLLLNSKPPIFKRGRFTTPVQLKQGVVWEALDPQAEAKLMNLDNGSLQFFPQMAQQFAGQIQNIMGGRTVTVNTGSKSSGFSKTAPGVKQAQDFMDSGTNQITKILENFLRQYALVALDLLLSEQVGEDAIIVDDETKDAINLVSANKFAPSLEQPMAVPPIGDDNKISIAWEDFYAAIEDWSVEVSVSLSKDELDDKKRADVQDTLVTLTQNPQAFPGSQETARELTNIMLEDKVPLASKLQEPMPQQPVMSQQPLPPQ